MGVCVSNYSFSKVCELKVQILEHDCPESPQRLGSQVVYQRGKQIPGGKVLHYIFKQPAVRSVLQFVKDLLLKEEIWGHKECKMYFICHFKCVS